MKKTLTIAAAALTLTLPACGTSLGGLDLGAEDIPMTGVTVAGVVVPATESGLMEPVTEPTLTITGTDGGEIDRIAALAIEDVSEFWSGTGLPGGGTFMPPDAVISYDSAMGDVPGFCDEGIGGVNAAYCYTDNTAAFDRGGLLPILRQNHGDVAVQVIAAHELGHSVDRQVEAANKSDTVIRGEQRADCYTGSYMRWAAEGNSKRFAVSPEGIDRALEVTASVSDDPGVNGGHGGTLERMWAFIQGFMHGPAVCADTTENDITLQTAGLPTDAASDAHWTSALAEAVAVSVSEITGAPAAVSGTCQTTIGAEWCEDGSGVAVDAAALQRMSEPPTPGVIGDGSGLSILTAALVQPWLEQHQKADDLNSRLCVMGAVGKELASGNHDITLAEGDLSEMALAAAMLHTSGFEAVKAFSEGVFVVDGLSGCVE